MMLAKGDRVRIKPNTDDAQFVGAHPPTGTVQSFNTDEHGPHVEIQLDDGAVIWSRSLSDWTFVRSNLETP